MTMSPEAGFRFNTINPIANNDWEPKWRDSHGNFEGVAYRSIALDTADAVERFVSYFSSSPGNPNFTGFDAAGTGDGSGDKEMEAIVSKARGEFDTERRRGLVFEIQRMAAKKQYALNFPGFANLFLVAWPAIKNASVYRGGTAPADSYEWLDQNEPPFKKT